MNFQQLEYFAALAESQHMTQTAKDLNISQPSLSYSISELEKEVGVPLFRKVGRNIRLTKHGKLYYQHALEALAAMKRADQIIANETQPFSGTIKLGFIYTQGTKNAPSLIKHFTALYPEVTFSLTQNTSANLLEKLQSEQLDLVISSYIPGFEAIDFAPLLVEELVLVVPQGHPLAEKESVSLSDIGHYALVYYNQNSGLRPYLDQLLKDVRTAHSAAVEVEDEQSILGFVSENYGIAIIPDVPSIAAYPVKKINILDNKTPRIIYLAGSRAAYHSPVVKLFKEYCLEYFDFK